MGRGTKQRFRCYGRGFAKQTWKQCFTLEVWRNTQNDVCPPARQGQGAREHFQSRPIRCRRRYRYCEYGSNTAKPAGNRCDSTLVSPDRKPGRSESLAFWARNGTIRSSCEQALRRFHQPLVERGTPPTTLRAPHDRGERSRCSTVDARISEGLLRDLLFLTYPLLEQVSHKVGIFFNKPFCWG